MGQRTTIEWTEATWNPTTGCDRISPGCDNCYALTLAKRLKAMGSAKYQLDGDQRTSGPGFGVTVHQDALTEPLGWRTPRRVFVNSMSDFSVRVMILKVPTSLCFKGYLSQVACATDVGHASPAICQARSVAPATTPLRAVA
jgi:protein gp37